MTTAVTTGAGTNIAGDHGTLHLNGDGSYTYQAAANNISSNATDVFVYTIKDGDGDLSTTTLTINLTDEPCCERRSRGDGLRESARSIRTRLDIAAGTVTGSLPGIPARPTRRTAHRQRHGRLRGTIRWWARQPVTAVFGTIQINSNGSYVYTLTKPFDTTRRATTAPTPGNPRQLRLPGDRRQREHQHGTIFVNIVDDIADGFV